MNVHDFVPASNRYRLKHRSEYHQGDFLIRNIIGTEAKKGIIAKSYNSSAASSEVSDQDKLNLAAR